LAAVNSIGMKKYIICLMIVMFTATVGKTQSLKPVDSTIVFYVVAKNNCEVLQEILGRCGSKNLAIEKMVMIDPEIIKSDLSNFIFFKFSITAGGEAAIENVKHKLSFIDGIINLYTVKNK
jgi:hypothetical protein